MESTTQEQEANENTQVVEEATTETDELVSLKGELEKAKADAAANLDGWQRARAEFANYKKRQEIQNAELRNFATQGLLSKLLPVQDDFERASKTLPEGVSHMTWIEGVMLIHRKLQLLLESEGVKPIVVQPNDPFNPSVHEAISNDDAPEGIESGHIIEELQKGYKIGERVIRPTLVRVAK
jgi:molecular chaperone GrpE